MEKVILGTIIYMCLSIIVAGLPQKLDEDTFAKYREECKTETGFDSMKADASQILEIPSAKCYIKCFAFKAGVVNDKGEPQLDKVSTVFDIPTGMDTETVIKRCYEDNKDKADICDRVSSMQKCIMNEIHKFATKS